MRPGDLKFLFNERFPWETPRDVKNLDHFESGGNCFLLTKLYWDNQIAIWKKKYTKLDTYLTPNKK